ncbi:hypothetical protein AB0N17_02805 [Streptomyces sp. NPDC051133]|uniref:hypothetical protein n=1 Tax=Streptomyces sp. NPDC051133 TaxID=3155521 RepID=UPI0034448263
MTTAAPTAQRKTLASLELPGTARLTAEQLRGADCVWCGTELHGDTSVDLEQRYNSIAGVVGRWFPRGCRRCTLQTVLAAYKTHQGSCEQCVDDPTLCDTHRALRRLALELRR